MKTTLGSGGEIIPMARESDSLNVAAATAIVLHHFRRQTVQRSEAAPGALAPKLLGFLLRNR